MKYKGLKSKTILITGASSGMGEATARELSAVCAKLILIARTESKLASLAKELSSRGAQVYYYPCDVSNIDEVKRQTEKIKQEVGIPDIIINNAGLGIWKSTEETDWQDVSDYMAVPYFGAFYMTKAFLPEMLQRKSGHIVNMTSYAGFIPFAGATAYIVARKAMIGFHEALTADLQGTGIKTSLAYFAKVESTYWEHNPGSESRLPGATVLIPAITPERAARAMVSGIAHVRKHIYAPWIIAFFNVLIQYAPFVARFLIYKTGHKRK